MSLSLPLKNSPLRNLFEIDILITWKDLPTFREAKLSAMSFMLKETGAKSVNSICIRSTGEIWLVRFGKRGGWKKLWNFGNPINK